MRKIAFIGGVAVVVTICGGSNVLMRGGQKLYRLFALSQKTLNIFSKNLDILFSKILHAHGRFCKIPQEIDLLLRYWFTTEIKAALVSYLFPASFVFWDLETNKRGQGLHGQYRGWYNNSHLKELVSSTVTVDVTVWEGHAKEGYFSGQAMGCKFFSFSFSLSFFFSFFFFQNYFWITI